MAVLANLQRIRFGVPTRYAMTQMTVDELELNAWITLRFSYGCSIIDGTMSAIGIYMFEDSRMHATNALIVIAYILISLVVSGSAIVGIRYTRLRKTAHGASIAKERTNTTTLGALADEQVEQEIIDSENRLINRILLVSWIYEVGSNAYPLTRMWWTAIIPLFLLIQHKAGLGDAVNGLITVLSIAGVSFLLPFMGHIAESWGYKYKEAAKRQEKQDKVVLYKALSQPNIGPTGKII